MEFQDGTQRKWNLRAKTNTSTIHAPGRTQKNRAPSRLERARSKKRAPEDATTRGRDARTSVFFTSPLRTPGRPDLVAIGQDCSYGSETVGRVAWWHLDRANCDFEMVPRVLAAGNISVRQFCAIWGLCAFACGPRLAMRDRLRNFHLAHTV